MSYALEKCFPWKRILSQFYPAQTTILEGLTKEEIRISNEALFKGVSTRFGLRTIERYIENLDFLFCQSFQNLRLGQPSATTSIVANKKVALSALGRKWYAGDKTMWLVRLRAPRSRCTGTSRRRAREGLACTLF